MLPYLNMITRSTKGVKYTRVVSNDDGAKSDSELQLEKLSIRTESSRAWIRTAIVVGIIVILFLAGGATSYFQLYNYNGFPTKRSCQSPALRQEWRSFSTDEQYDYINAAQCLRSIPSRLHDGMSIYDDFPFLHDVVGDYAHGTAAFLTWHRYFIHLYESLLIDTCNYKGSLPYWDWSLDWKELATSPVFYDDPGFGGDSHPNSTASEEAIIGGDRCLHDGAWAGMTVHWWTQSAPPHCLSRGFNDITPINEMGHHVSNEVIEQLLQQPDYESFFLMMEHGIHNAVQIAIGGDIMFNTAPYDPLFYLHHSQLDRIWWRWQQIHPSHQMQYLGLANNVSDARASLNDLISMGDFAPPVTVKELMNTEAGILCYRY